MTDDEKKAGNPQVNLRLPEQLGLKLLKDAKKQKQTVQAVILSILAEHYSIDVDVPQRGRPKSAGE
jgi:hypothetical protein